MDRISFFHNAHRKGGYSFFTACMAVVVYTSHLFLAIQFIYFLQRNCSSWNVHSGVMNVAELSAQWLSNFDACSLRVYILLRYFEYLFSIASFHNSSDVSSIGLKWPAATLYSAPQYIMPNFNSCLWVEWLLSFMRSDKKNMKVWPLMWNKKVFYVISLCEK